MPIQLKGKEYKTVAERLLYFWEHYPGRRIITSVERGAHSCIVTAKIVSTGDGEVVSTGHAEGIYQSSGDKVLEKTETCAVGRALALLGDPSLMGTDIASADEIATWVQHGNDQALLDHVAVVRDNWESIVYIKHHLGEADAAKMNNKDSWMDLETALEAWRELGEDVMKALWRAPSKGGIFTTLERKLLDEASTEDYKRRKAGE